MLLKDLQDKAPVLKEKEALMNVQQKRIASSVPKLVGEKD